MTRDLTRLALALNEVAAALLELADGTPEAAAPPAASGHPVAAVAFVQTPQPAAAPAGMCPVHGTPWKTTKRDGTSAKRAYCSQKMPDGSYCDQQGPWLTQPPFAA